MERGDAGFPSVPELCDGRPLSVVNQCGAEECRRAGVERRERSDRRRMRRGPEGTAEVVSVDWAELYEVTYADLVRFLHRKVWDVERARDLAQEVFVRALDQSPDNPRAWLFTVAANLARDEARTEIRRKKHLTLIRNESEEVESANPGAELEAKERVLAVRTALESLRDRDRDVLLLWDAGLSYADIAAQTGLAPGAIGTTLSRARRRLVEAYEELEERHAARG